MGYWSSPRSIDYGWAIDYAWLRGDDRSDMESTSHSSEALPQSQIGASRSSSLPPSDSPLTKVFLGQYVSSLTQETITYLRLSYSDLALLMFIPEMVLRDAVEGKMGLTRGQWVRLGQELELPTTYQLRPAERDGAPCWEICFPPVSLMANKT